MQRWSSLVLLLWWSTSSSSSDDQCALLIPGRHDSEPVCISYNTIDSAFIAATHRMQSAHGPHILPDNLDGRHMKATEIESLGKTVHETAAILGRDYGLSRDSILNGLYLIDTERTLIKNHCPDYFMQTSCEMSRYRSISGMCNNHKNAHWGAAMFSHHRFLPPAYSDGVSAVRRSISGKKLPSARRVSALIHPDEGFHDHAVTVMLVAFGQFIDHDITLTAETRDPITRKAPDCCKDRRAHQNCLPIEIPENDKFYSKHGQKCLNFVRSLSGLKPGCKLGPRDSINEISSVLDANTLYSNSEEKLVSLRSFDKGKLKMLPVFREHGLKNLLPLKLEEPNEGCIRPSPEVYCFEAGDSRVNEQTVLALVHTLFAREHNRVCDKLATINPHWNDETIFHEARHIMAAMIQHITYNEFLPMVLGKEIMEKNSLRLQKDGYTSHYNPDVNPSAANGFITAAFRFGHTLLPSTIERWSKKHRYVSSQRLSHMLQQPYDLYKRGWADTYLLGLVNQVAQAYDHSVTQEVTNHLFQEPGKPTGMDLAAINIQRARDHGIPPYNEWRRWCGLPAARSWSDLRGLMSNRTIAGYASIYESPEDVDLWTAAINERPVAGSMLGPTFACMVGRQFANLRHGDRYWYENGGWPSSFTLEQLNEVRKVKLSHLICDNSDSIETVQVWAMVLPDHEINPRVPCNSGIMPRMDLDMWRDARSAEDF